MLFATSLVSAILLLSGVLIIKAIRRRNNRRSPLRGKKIANLPGQQLMARTIDHGENLSFAFILMYFSLPLTLGAWSIHHVDWRSVRFGFDEALFLTAGIGVFGYGLWMYARSYGAYMAAKEGQIAEQITGQLLNRLMGPKCIVAHDMPCENFNIDHIVIAPRAVYAVETKSFRKPAGSSDSSHYKVAFDGNSLQFPDFRSTKVIEQARRQSQWLGRYLKESLGRDVPVIPAIALPGWWVERLEGARKSDIRVFTPMGRGAEFLLSGEEILDGTTRTLIAQAVAQKYPSVDK
ncbi:hypothetical protein B1992_01060 [Pseudoxanthomonas broegbernensis]|uniref:NERD domain-containing protein n=1 Tax=Pseudoxanthomonas broegbernensis TaxID=83619 RepID=A0A7V8GQ48_9GAMM|nr:hypothetical protein B1992_01060 [Pseudoxanthomonas broegbernensis]